VAASFAKTAHTVPKKMKDVALAATALPPDGNAVSPSSNARRISVQVCAGNEIYPSAKKLAYFKNPDRITMN
jgi:hypothetical protein